MSVWELLSSLWLNEPDATTIARGSAELAFPSAAPEELAIAYSEALVLGVPPYGTTFSSAAAELYGESAERYASLFKALHWDPAELRGVAAPDHIGICLAFLAEIEGRGLLQQMSAAVPPPAQGAAGGVDPVVLSAARWVLSDFLAWAPLCIVAVEREPFLHPFYRHLAVTTGYHLVELARVHSKSVEIEGDEASIDGDEMWLGEVADFFLAPARCGFYLSRANLGRMARQMGTRLPFGSRREVALSLFRSVEGEEGVSRLLDNIESERRGWVDAQRSWHRALTGAAGGTESAAAPGAASDAASTTWAISLEASAQMLKRLRADQARAAEELLNNTHPQ